MTDREKIIDALKDAIAYFRSCFDAIGGTLVCEMFRRWSEAIEQAVAFLKAQEARVMTLEEVKQHNNQNGCVWFEQPTYNADAAFAIQDEECTEIISPYILGEPINHGYWSNSNYNVTWRCWTSRPDEKRRAETPWNL